MQPDNPSEPQAASPLLVAALCAQWCNTCTTYQPQFEAQEASFGSRARCVWIDIEDQAEVMGALDVENFPTLLIARGDEVLFFGTVLPHVQTMVRLVQSALTGDLKPVQDDEVRALARRVRAVV